MSMIVIAGIYLGVGAAALCFFDYRTKRIRSKLMSKSVETQSAMAASNVPLPGGVAGGTYVGHKTALVLLIAATWLFWPAIFIGALTDRKENR